MSKNKCDLSIGETFGRWTVIGDVIKTRYPSGDYKRQYPCQCKCGTVKNVIELSLRNGSSVSCGCYHKERVAKSSRKHGHSKKNARTETYSSWQAMKSRCFGSDPHCIQYYQSRGITVCDRWMDFENFLSDMGERPKDATIERINNDGNYCPQNCRWVTRADQNRNTRRNHNITYKGVTMCRKDWAKELGMPETTLYYRLKRLPIDQAFDISQYKRRKK